MVNGAYRICESIVLIWRQSQKRLGDIARQRLYPSGVLLPKHAILFQVGSNALKGLLLICGANQAVDPGPGLLQQLAQQVGAQEAGGAGQQHRLGVGVINNRLAFEGNIRRQG